MQRDRIWTLMSRKLSGEATQAELQELDELIKSHPEFDIPTQFVSEYWSIPTESEDDFLEATFHLHNEKLKSKGYHLNTIESETGSLKYQDMEKHKKNRKWFVAAVMSLSIFAIVFSIFYYNAFNTYKQSQPIAKSEISTKNGSRSKIQLPDGTSVWLNSSSKLTYNNENFGGSIREVSLVGEAYFDVVKNPSKPFVIHTAKMDIKVLGTAFNVKSYPTDKTTETSLIHGSVEVTLNDRQEKIMLKPSEKLIFNTLQNKSEKINTLKDNLKINEKEKPIIELSHLTIYPIDNSIVETAWMENKLVFRNESLEDIALKMERWYGVSIVISNEKLKKELITGSFEKETIYQALKALQFTNKFNYVTEKDKIIISK
jgi:transmembrane sensor